MCIEEDPNTGEIDEEASALDDRVKYRAFKLLRNLLAIKDPQPGEPGFRENREHLHSVRSILCVFKRLLSYFSFNIVFRIFCLTAELHAQLSSARRVLDPEHVVRRI